MKPKKKIIVGYSHNLWYKYFCFSDYNYYGKWYTELDIPRITKTNERKNKRIEIKKVRVTIEEI